MERNHDVSTFISKCLYFKSPRVAIFTDITKMLTTSIRTIFKKTQKKIKEFEIMQQTAIHIYIYWYSKIC